MVAFRNDRLIKALLKEPVDRTPVWLMRQAGRYLPEYRQLRSQAEHFMTFCKTPELACEATLQPLQRFDLDAAIVFSDILTIPDAMGMTVDVTPQLGPVIHRPIASMRAVEALLLPDVHESLSYVFETIRWVCRELQNRVPVIGFAGSPWTLACYMVEGKSSKTFHGIKSMLYRAPDILHALLERLARITIDYLNAQMEAGARVIMLFDTWGGILTPSAYREFSLRYLAYIASALNRNIAGETIPLIFYTKQANAWLEDMVVAGCDAIGLDWTIDLGEARRRVGDRVALQGNLDPAVLLAEPVHIRAEVQRILQSYGSGPGLVFNVGHGVDQATPLEHVSAMIAAVHEGSSCML